MIINNSFSNMLPMFPDVTSQWSWCAWGYRDRWNKTPFSSSYSRHGAAVQINVKFIGLGADINYLEGKEKCEWKLKWIPTMHSCNDYPHLHDYHFLAFGCAFLRKGGNLHLYIIFYITNNTAWMSPGFKNINYFKCNKIRTNSLCE